MKNQKWFALALLALVGLVSCGNNSSSSSEKSDSTLTSPISEEVSTSSPASSSVESSSSKEEKTVFGTWKGTLVGYDEEDEENMDDIEDITIVINEDLSGSYRGIEVTWKYFDDEESELFGKYRFISPDGDYDVSCLYQEADDTLSVKWRNFEGEDYKLGTFTR